ncbi:LysR family transcriptional regulator [Paracidovorax valerianellae]|uniref:DNA-binding transcriptional regulator, LysR family n=1 Tax=Paracidovorax valerianellae TaxID=187868 RepID=A0A1G6UQS6_9BURK|nr:LysR family transcriptional regulator [Paracidovorax valerianellae]MDA8446876.1 LysR family transcriptional regulator [Paracidovorax valerianellae]SDD43748.1 DNA-binding transcriptional regulator, LysR family [Paracidovorax valerianellae]
MAIDIKAMDLNLLKALDALLDERSVTRAAQRLSLTQPAVSGMLTRLRESFGDPLFVRTQRGIAPTLRAQELAGPVKDLLGSVEALLQPSAFDPATATMTLTIAATDYALQAVVVPFLGRLRRCAPHMRVAVVPAQHLPVQDRLERGDIDLALVSPANTPPGLYSRHLFDERYVCVMREDHPDARGGPLSLDCFCALDHVLISYDGGSFRGATDEALAGVGRERRVLLSVTSFLVLPEILRNSDLIAVVPQRLVTDAAGLIVREPPLPIPGFAKTAAWHERTHRSPGHRWARSVLFDAFGCGD